MIRSESPQHARKIFASQSQFKISTANKQKKRIEMGGIKVERDSNFHEVELLRAQLKS